MNDQNRSEPAAPAVGSHLDRRVMPRAWLCEWDGWRQTHLNDEDPLPLTWDDEPPLRVTELFTREQLEAAVAAEREKWTRPPRVYSSCQKHMGQSYTVLLQPAALMHQPVQYVCPHCEAQRGGRHNVRAEPPP